MPFQGTWAVDGFRVPGTLWRLQLRSATRNGNGIVEMGDLRVAAKDTPGPAVTVKDGACVAAGAETLWQGSYYGYNLGDEDVQISPTGGTARSDLIYARVEDPTISSSPWDHTGPDDQLWYLRVASGVSSSAKTIPVGYTGVALARVDIPANTTNITQAMITDLRQMVDPRSLVKVFTKQGEWGGTDDNQNYIDFVGGKITYSAWPHDGTFDVDIPEWASTVKVIYTWDQVQFLEGASVGSGQTKNADGSLRVTLGSLATDPVRYLTSANTPNYNRFPVGSADTLAIPAAMRGTTQTLTMQGKATANSAGTDRATTGGLQCDGGSSLYVQLVFEEAPVADAPDRSLT